MLGGQPPLEPTFSAVRPKHSGNMQPAKATHKGGRRGWVKLPGPKRGQTASGRAETAAAGHAFEAVAAAAAVDAGHGPMSTTGVHFWDGSPSKPRLLGADAVMEAKLMSCAKAFAAAAQTQLTALCADRQKVVLVVGIAGASDTVCSPVGARGSPPRPVQHSLLAA